MDRVEEAACEEEELVRVLRVACLQSVVNSGLKPKILESYRRTVTHSYGYKHVMSLYNLDKVTNSPKTFVQFDLRHRHGLAQGRKFGTISFSI